MFHIEEADFAEFARFSAFYRRDNMFRSGYDELFNLFCPSTPCYWVTRGGERVGGAVLGEGLLSNVFIIPPFSQRSALLRHLVSHVRTLSSGRIYAHNIMLADTDDYFALGFRLSAELRSEGGEAPDYAFGFMRAMARPTQRMDNEPPEGFTVKKLTLRDVKRASILLSRAYAGKDPQRTEPQDFIRDTDIALRVADESCREASCALWYDGNMAGVCVITRWEGWPLVFDVASDPVLRGRGAGRYMLRRALDILQKHGEPALKLFVELGNPAEALYREMGFVGSEASTSMYLDP